MEPLDKRSLEQLLNEIESRGYMWIGGHVGCHVPGEHHLFVFWGTKQKLFYADSFVGVVRKATAWIDEKGGNSGKTAHWCLECERHKEPNSIHYCSGCTEYDGCNKCRYYGAKCGGCKLVRKYLN